MSKYLTPLLILAVAVLVIALAIKGGQVVTAWISQNVTTVPQAEVANAAPTVAVINCTQGTSNLNDGVANVTLTGGGSATISCYAYANDVNGEADLTDAASNGRFFSGGYTGAADVPTCTDDVRICYVNGSATSSNCQLFAYNTTAKVMQCNFGMKFNADNTSKAGNWTFFANISDISGLIGNTTKQNYYVAELLAIDVPSSLDFGTIAAGTNMTNVGKVNTACTAACNFTVSNYGNVRIDPYLNGTNMNCTQGTIDVGYIKYNCTDAGTYAAAAALTTSPSVTYCDSFDLAENNTAGVASTTTPTATTKKTYWGIGAPIATRGTCTGTIQFSAFQG